MSRDGKHFGLSLQAMVLQLLHVMDFWQQKATVAPTFSYYVCLLIQINNAINDKYITIQTDGGRAPCCSEFLQCCMWNK